MFRKKPPPTPGRQRPSPANPSASRATVFSYYANRSTRSGVAAARSAGSNQPWAGNDTSPMRVRSPQRIRLKRLLATAMTLAIVGLVINSLLLNGGATVVAYADATDPPHGGRQLFLRSKATYERAAKELLAGSWANTNKITINADGLGQALKRQFPELAEVSVTLPMMGRHPIIHVQSTTPSLLFKSVEGGLFVVDASGRALMDATELQQIAKLGLPVIEDQSGLPVRLGSIALPSGEVAFITEVAGQLKAKGIAVIGMTIPQGTSELDVRPEGVPYIIKFNLRGDARAEAGTYLAVRGHLERERKTPATYIDVRADNRAYYR